MADVCCFIPHFKFTACGVRMTDSGSLLPHLHVTCAIIEREGLVLAAQRSAVMSMPLKWEFPGGKINPGEAPAACLHRELREELGIWAGIGLPLPLCTYSYPGFTITLYPFLCTIESGEIGLHEHLAVRWLRPDELMMLDWTAADVPVLEAYLAWRNEGLP